MIRPLYLIGMLILLWAIVSTAGWHFACNKPCDPEQVVTTVYDTTYIPTPVFIHTDADSLTKPKPKTALGKAINKVFGKKDPTKHWIKPGENLYRIGLKYGMTANQLRIINGFPDYNIKANRWLKLGTPEERAAAAALDSTKYSYEIPFGDSVNVKGMATIQSEGKITYQNIHYELMGPYKPKGQFYFGGAADFDRNLYAAGAYRFKNGVLVIGEVGLTEKSYQIGVLKQLDFKNK